MADKMNHLKAEGARDGAPFANWQWRPSTTRAHQWVQYGVEKHKADKDRLNAALFHALFEDGQNISLVDTLVSLGQAEFANCDEDDLRDYLEYNKGNVLLQQEIVKVRRQYNVQSVPFFVIERVGSTAQPYRISGAQRAETFRNIFEELAHE